MSGVKAYQKDKGIQVSWNTATTTETNVQEYQIEKSVNGEHFEKVFTIATKAEKGTSHNYSWLDENVGSGNNFYRIKIIKKSGDIKYSSLEKVKIAAGKSSLTVYPDPVTGNVISLQLLNMEEGDYTLGIYNMQGQNMSGSSFYHSGGSASRNVFIKQKIAAGKYILQLSNNKMKITKPILVQ